MTRTLALPDLVDAPPADDLYRYGSRLAVRAGPDGTLYSEQLPLTIWDVLHPQEGDHITQSIRHQKEVRYLTDVIESRLAQDRRALVMSDTPIYWDTPGLSHHSPDVAVIYEVRKRKEQYTSFHVAQETVRPGLIIEVVSPHVRDNDTNVKFKEYHKAEVPLYVIIDRQKEDDWPTILAYTWEPGEYKQLALDDRDCILLPRLNLRLCANQNRITLYDAVTGEEMGDYFAVSQALEAEAHARQEAEERERKAQEQARLAVEREREAQEQARLAAEQKREAEKQASLAAERERKAEEQARHAGEQKREAEERARKSDDRARAEADARADLERRLRELEAKLQDKPEP
jgi:colicin import membrane protein